MADCFGIRTALITGKIRHEHLSEIEAQLANSGIADQYHFSGLQRAANIKVCLREGYYKTDWSACKSKLQANIDFTNQVADKLRKFSVAFQNSSVSFEGRASASAMADQLDDGLQKVVRIVDRECPYAMMPEFIEAVGNYELARRSFKEVARV